MILKNFFRKLIVKYINMFSQDSVKEINDGLTTSAELKKLCRQAGADSCVLLKNDGVLPFNAKNNIAVFGRVQSDCFYTGYGSGGDVKPPYKISFIEGLKNSGLTINVSLLKKYEQWTKKHAPYDGFWGFWPMNYDEMPLSDAALNDAAKQSDCAVIFIGRSAGEDREIKLKRGSWYLTKTEETLLKKVTKAFDKVCVVLNCGSIFDVSWIKKYNVKAVLYAWQLGQESGNALADILSGKVSPSGKLTDTLALYKDYPSKKYFGKRRFNNYVEDIYVGYRYFETFAKEKVLYPFGFGLSYTSFKLCVLEFNTSNNISVKVLVTNTGKTTGKEVVQIYYGAPQGKLGKPSKCLAAFKKTKLLLPGENQEMLIEFNACEMASFDDIGVTNNKNAFVLEEGAYILYVGTDVRSSEKFGEYVVNRQTVVSVLSEACNLKKSFNRIVNRGGIAYERTPFHKDNVKERILKSLPLEIKQTKDNGYKLMDVKLGAISLDQFIAQLSDEELEFLSRESNDGMYSSLGAVGNAGVFGGTTMSLRKKGIPIICANDGPSGIRLQAHSTLIPNGVALASTFDTALVEELLSEIGCELNHRNSHVLLAPGMNIHRNPLCGRNFEYFSEDPLLTGKIAAAYVLGAQWSGVSAVPKHFACNNQETARHVNDARVSQRALREIYLKSFEICVKEAAPHFIMTAYNKVNGALCCYNYDLATQVLRNDWGFKGCVLTDWWINKGSSPIFKNVYDQAYRIRAQVDIFMPGTAKTGKYKGKSDGTLLKSLYSMDGVVRGELQRTAKNILMYCIKYRLG